MSRLINLFQTLVKIDSPSGAEMRLADFVIEYFSKRNIRAEKDTYGNIFVTISGTGEPLFIAAHMDTVEPGRGIQPIISDGVITSKNNTILGADNKATLAVILEIIQRLHNKTHRPLEILFTVGEETSGIGAIHFNYQKIKAKKGIIADIALPVGTIVLASPAYVHFKIVVEGKTAHAAVPHRAKSILPALGAILSGMQTGIIDDKTIFNIGIGKFGSAVNAVPGSAALSGEIRSYDESLLELHQKKIVTQLEKIEKKFGVSIETTFTLENPAYQHSSEDTWVKELAAVMKQQNIKLKYINNWSVSDANFYNKRGITVVNIGDGTEKTHTVNERIAIADMEKLASILEAVCLL